MGLVSALDPDSLQNGNMVPNGPGSFIIQHNANTRMLKKKAAHFTLPCIILDTTVLIPAAHF